MTSVWLARGCTTSYRAKSGEDEANAKKGEGSRLRNRRRSQEAVVARAVYKVPDDLRRVVDAQEDLRGCAGHIELGEAAADVEEAMGPERAVGKIPDDLRR